MLRPILTAIVIATLTSPLVLAQAHQKHHLWVGLGAAQPREDLNQYFRDSFAWGLGYGYRPWKYLQFDGGMESAVGAGRVEDFFNSPAFGPLDINDYQFFFPFGARAVLPVAGGRAEFYGGGGGVYARYTELLRQPSEWIRVGCPVCGARDGWGSYAMAGGNIALDRNKMFRLGATVKVYRVSTEGDRVGDVPPISTTDRWINTYIYFSFSF